jgi:hypothetical protein
MEQLSASEKDGGKVRQLQKELGLAQDKELALLSRLDRVQMENQVRLRLYGCSWRIAPSWVWIERD